MKPLKNLVKSTIEQSRAYLYHKDRNDTAKKVLKTIEAEKGQLNVRDKNLCKEYSKDVFGNEKYAPWLYVYSAYAQEFKEGWIPDNYYGEVVIPNINGAYGKICNRNAVISNLLSVNNTLDICYFVNHLFLDINYKILNEENLKKTLFHKSKKVVYKIEDSAMGKGIYFFDQNTFDINKIYKLGNGVFQSYIEQHEFFSDFTNTSVATIRITSVCDSNGNVEIKASYFRFGSNNDTHVQSASAMRIAIDINNGKLCEDAYFPNWKSTKKIPGIDISFSGKVIPYFVNCLTEVKKMHARIPFVRCIGWDMIVDSSNNVRLIELNGGHSGIRFSETVQGPCFLGLNWENLHILNRSKNGDS